MSVMEFRKQEPEGGAVTGGAMDRVVVRKKIDKRVLIAAAGGAALLLILFFWLFAPRAGSQAVSADRLAISTVENGVFEDFLPLRSRVTPLNTFYLDAVEGESALDHPCQALGDWKTLDDLGVPSRARFVLTWANHPKPLPLAVPSAAVRMAALRGMEVVVLRPDDYELPEPVMARARAAAASSGGRVLETSDRDEALAGASAVYAKSWASPRLYGDAAAEAEVRSTLGDWCVDVDWFERAAPDARFFHCLPVRRNVVVSDAVLDSPRSAVVRQAHNRLWAQMAVLHRLLGGVR